MSHAHACEVHAEHRPRVSDSEIHHIWPSGQGGPDIAANRIPLCPTGHTNVHNLLRAWIKAKGEPAWEIRRDYHPAERELARRGYIGITERKVAP